MFCQWCRKNFIHLILFFPNSTRILQMCDVGMFGSGKKHWAREVQTWRIHNKDKEFDEIEFVKVLKKVNDKFITRTAIMNGFRATGIYPLNVENVKFDRCLGSSNENQDSFVHEQHDDENSSIETEPVLISTNHQLPTSNQENVLISIINIQNDLETIVTPDIKANHPNLVLTVQNIEQQMLILRTTYSGQNSIIPSSEASNEKSISDILVTPKPFARASIRRSYKMKNYGVMTSDETMEVFQMEKEAKSKLETEKNQRKDDREQRKIQNETLRTMKKEATEKRQRQEQLYDEAPLPKKRGRAPKQVHDEAPFPKKRGRKPKQS